MVLVVFGKQFERIIRQLTTLYKNNSGLIAKTKVSKYNKGLCLTEKLVFQNPLLFLYSPLATRLAHSNYQK